MADPTEFDDPRLVAVYDTLNPYAPGTQPDFYVGLARELGAATVVEIGCGTGLVTAAFVRAGFDVVGLEPSALMLERARRRPAARGARWIHGDVAALDVRDADLVVMAGHVAQFFLTDDAWRDVLGHARAVLGPGGRLAFETRNPAARAWEAWTPERTRRTVHDPVAGEIETWAEVPEVHAAERPGAHAAVVDGLQRYRFAATGEVLTARTALRFRTVEEVDASLSAAGFAVERRYGGWDRRPFGPEDQEIVVVAQVR